MNKYSKNHRLGRRQFLQATAFTGIALMAPGALASTGNSDRELQFVSLDEALAELAQLAGSGEPVSHTTWNWAKTLTHCAQSIEFSMTGFPESKSALFQNTVGAAAYNVFAWRGRMTHDLAEPIPGAPALDDATDIPTAETRLRAAIEQFRQWQGEFKSHFAYGELSKAQYELAHAMHLANHFSFFRASSV